MHRTVRPVVGAHRARRLPFANSLAGVALLATALTAQTPPGLAPGFDAADVWIERSSPFGVGGLAPADTPGAFLVAIDHQILHVDAAGNRTPLRSFASGTRPGLLTRPLPGGPLYYSDDATTLFVRDLASGRETTHPVPAWTFDLDVTSTGTILVNANPGFPGPNADTGIWAIDPQGGAPREIARLSGPSGPLLVDRSSDDVLVAVLPAGWPIPPGSVNVLRFPGARIRSALQAGGAPLTLADAVVHTTGLDNAYDLVRDDRGALYVSDSNAGGIRRIHPDGTLDPTPLAAADGTATLSLAFVDGSAATFDPWQPDDGGALWIGIADWATYAGLRVVHAARPRASSSTGAQVPPGPWTLTWTGLPPGSLGIALFNDRTPFAAPRLITHHLGVPIWSAIDFATPPIPTPLIVDANGTASLGYQWPGGASWLLVSQAAVVEAGPMRRLATSGVLSVQLLR